MQRPATVILVLVSIALLALVGCGGSGSGTGDTTTTAAVAEPTTESTGSGGPQTTFSLEQLADFDGKNGTPAYVAVDGVVYDVTGSRSWPDGEHIRCNLDAMAGQDLSQQIESAPANMRALLEALPVVGTLAQ